MKYSDLTEKIINAAYKVHNVLGFGFLEKVYQNALMIELKGMGLKVSSEMPIKVYYRNKIVGEYIADIIVEDKVILELKAVKDLAEIHEVQLVNYLKATGIEVGLLINFGHSVQVKRKVFDKI
ncbi:MAG: GxxExxY protein [Deltaproteobacteria bacterium]|nr:GxxExxY protein [Deltaproteobacteria bacterium]MBW2074732.1 GxxExxY protein [Deltaproteobacteria bacterium]RLB79825.1 MAG: GxxExxY protein [Deltaproteobacteria bacterium]